MDDIARTQQVNLADKTTSPPFNLPLVSVIIVNYNYGRFLTQAADFVFEQTYPNIECIIVDNASTDCSASVLLDISRQYPGAVPARSGWLLLIRCHSGRRFAHRRRHRRFPE
jgi:glycosyltransferase involved in cell wall biosynthesis